MMFEKEFAEQMKMRKPQYGSVHYRDVREDLSKVNFTALPYHEGEGEGEGNTLMSVLKNAEVRRDTLFGSLTERMDREKVIIRGMIKNHIHTLVLADELRVVGYKYEGWKNDN